MATPFLGQLSLVPFGFPPKGWALCNGQLMQINTNQALFSLIGTTYGGDGRVTFALPDLRGRVAISSSSTVILGQTLGTESVVLTQAQVPAHTHQLSVANTTGGTGANPVGNTVGTSTANAYAGTANDVMAASAISSTGGSQPHENRSPFLVLNWIIALQGIFPSRN